MLKYIKDVIENTATKYFVIKEVQLLTVAFSKPENCLIRQGNVEISRYAQRKPKVPQAKSQLQLYSEKWRAATALIAERVFAYMRQMSGICCPDNLNSLTDLRTGEIFEDFQRTLNTADKSKPNDKQTHEYLKENEDDMQKMLCNLNAVYPKPNDKQTHEYLKENENKMQKMLCNLNAVNSKPNDKQTQEYLKENEDEMQKMLCNLKRQRDLRREKANSLSNESVDGLKYSTQIKQIQQVEGSVTKTLKEMLRSGELILKVAETNKKDAKEDKQDKDKQGLLNIDDVLKCEEAKKEAETKHVITKTASIEPSDSSSSHGDYTAYYVKAQQRDYLRNFIEFNRMMERRMMNLRDPRKSDDTEKVREDLSVKTDKSKAKSTEYTVGTKECGGNE